MRSYVARRDVAERLMYILVCASDSFTLPDERFCTREHLDAKFNCRDAATESAAGLLRYLMGVLVMLLGVVRRSAYANAGLPSPCRAT